LHFLAIILDIVKILLIFLLSANYYFADVKHKDDALKMLVAIAIPILLETSKKLSDKPKPDPIECKIEPNKIDPPKRKKKK
jgi:hypothetical protein